MRHFFTIALTIICSSICIAQENFITMKCDGLHEKAGQKEVIKLLFNIDVRGVNAAPGNGEFLDMDYKIYSRTYSPTEPVSQFSTTFQLWHWKRNIGNNLLEFFDFIEEGRANISVKVNLDTGLGSFDSYSSNNAIALNCIEQE